MAGSANSSEPIYALGSALGKSALAVIRVSGQSLPEELYNSLSVSKAEKGFFVRDVSFSGISETCLVLSFPAPASYLSLIHI